MLQSLKRRIEMLVATALVKAVKDSEELQALTLSLLEGEEREELEHMLPYGFTHNPHEGSEAVVVFPDGDRSFGLVLAVADRRYRLTGLEAGEVALYDDQGQSIELRRDKLVVNAPHGMTIDCPMVDFTGDITVGGVQFLPHTHGDVLNGSSRTSEPA